jgi:LysM repeat protein
MNKIQPGQKIKMPDGSEHVVQKGETLSGIIAGKKAAAPTPAAPTPAAPTPAAPVANANTTVNPLAGAKPPSPQPDVTPNVATQPATTTAPVLGTPENPYPQGAPVTSGSGETWRTSDGSALRTRSDAEIGDTNPRTGVVTPGSFDKNRAQGEKNLNSLKNLFGFGKKEAPAPISPTPATPATQSATTTPSAGTGSPLGGVKTPPASRI